MARPEFESNASKYFKRKANLQRKDYNLIQSGIILIGNQIPILKNCPGFYLSCYIFFCFFVLFLFWFLKKDGIPFPQKTVNEGNIKRN